MLLNLLSSPIAKIAVCPRSRHASATARHRLTCANDGAKGMKRASICLYPCVREVEHEAGQLLYRPNYFGLSIPVPRLNGFGMAPQEVDLCRISTIIPGVLMGNLVTVELRRRPCYAPGILSCQTQEPTHGRTPPQATRGACSSPRGGGQRCGDRGARARPAIRGSARRRRPGFFVMGIRQPRPLRRSLTVWPQRESYVSSPSIPD